jgi:hypothetical protein
MNTIPFLDIHVSHVCNFRCHSCTHFAGGDQGLVSLNEAEAWMKKWQHRFQPEIFGMLGGEPTLHPQLCDFLVLARRYWPKSTLHLMTNGFYIARHPNLPETLEKTDSVLYLTKHDSSPYYMLAFRQIVEIIETWRKQYSFRFHYRHAEQEWQVRYHGTGGDILPFEDSIPRKSWENCPSRKYVQLFQGKLWKCCSIAYLHLQKEAYPNLSSKWDPYLAYKPLCPDCSDEELERFLSAEEEPICAMCPAQKIMLKKPSPLAAPATPKFQWPKRTSTNPANAKPAKPAAVHDAIFADFSP